MIYNGIFFSSECSPYLNSILIKACCGLKMWWQLYLRCEYTWQRAGSWPRNNCSLCCILESTASLRAVGGALEGVPGGRGAQFCAEQKPAHLSLVPTACLPSHLSTVPGKEHRTRKDRTNQSDHVSTQRESGAMGRRPQAEPKGEPVTMEAGCLGQGTGAVQGAAQARPSSVSLPGWVSCCAS